MIDIGKDGFASFSLADLENEELPPRNWVVHDFLPQGLTLFLGKPKVGKSWFMLQLGLAMKRKKLDQVEGISFQNKNRTPRELLDSLSFSLTDAQKRVIKEIYKDLDSEKQMNMKK